MKKSLFFLSIISLTSLIFLFNCQQPSGSSGGGDKKEEVVQFNPQLGSDANTITLWRCNENSGTNLADSSPIHNRSLTFAAAPNNPGWAASGLKGFGSCLSLKGGVDKTYASCTTDDTFTAISIEFWLKTTSNWGFLLFTKRISVNLDGGGKMMFQLDSATGWNSVSSNNSINDGNWHFIVCTYDQIEMKVYIDGVLDGRTPNNFAILNPEYYNLGGNNAGNGSPACLIDEFRISSIARTSAEITNYYNNVIDNL